MTATELARRLTGRAKDTYVLASLKAIEGLDETGDVPAFAAALREAASRAEIAVEVQQ